MPDLNEQQKLFLRIHKYHVVSKINWVLGGATVRSTTKEGITISLGAHDLAPLAEFGAIMHRTGANIYLTEKGKSLI